jgi:hypothetical protein
MVRLRGAGPDPIIINGPLIFWMYPAFGIRGASWFIGIAEWLFGALALIPSARGASFALTLPARVSILSQDRSFGRPAMSL